jgi:hypothetical protein
MPLTEEELEQIKDTIGDVVNGISSRDELQNQLHRLRLKHGELPFLLSTEADFIDSIEVRLSLYKRVVELSLTPLDASCLTQSAESIAEIYIEELRDYHNGYVWMERLKEFVSLHGSKHICSPLSELEVKLNRLNIKSV